jgi:hypothetical protein
LALWTRLIIVVWVDATVIELGPRRYDGRRQVPDQAKGYVIEQVSRDGDLGLVLNVSFWRFSEVAPAANDGCLRVPSGLSKAVQATFLSSGLNLCGQLHRPNVFQDAPKVGLRREAHGSISVQEGQPNTFLI